MSQSVSNLPASTTLSANELSMALMRNLVNNERDRSALVRRLHDELGGFLVGALMDLSWVTQQRSATEAGSEKLARAMSLLREAIDLKREVIEQLKPTLLDNVGLFSALRWHLKAKCSTAGVSYSESYPPEEVELSSEVRTTIFRILEQLLVHFLSRAGAIQHISCDVDVVEQTLHFQLRNARGADQQAPSDETDAALVAEIQFRAAQIEASLTLSEAGQHTQFDLRVPVP